MKRMMWRIQRLEKRILPQPETVSMRVLRQRIGEARRRVAEWDAAHPDVREAQRETESDRMLQRARMENLRFHLEIKGPVPFD